MNIRPQSLAHKVRAADFQDCADDVPPGYWQLLMTFLRNASLLPDDEPLDVPPLI